MQSEMADFAPGAAVFDPVYVFMYACLSILSVRYSTSQQEAQLSQRDRATRYVSKFVLCFTKYGS